MITLKAEATSSGRVVDYFKFQKGELINSTRWNFFMTTLLTDVITDLIELAKEIDPACAIIPLFPNGFSSSSFDISIKGKDFQINCGRRLVRGWFPLNPLAAEFGKNYDVLLSVIADNLEVEKKISEYIRIKYKCETLTALQK